MLQQHVFPEFKSPVGFLRSRALWIYGEFATLKYTDENHFNLTINQMYQLLFDTDLPCRLMAGISLQHYLHHDKTLVILKPALKDLLTKYLAIMNEIDNEELVCGLEEIVKRYHEDVEPFAIDLC